MIGISLGELSPTVVSLSLEVPEMEFSVAGAPSGIAGVSSEIGGV